MDNLEKIRILNERISNINIHISALEQAINDGCISNKGASLEEIKQDHINMRMALELHMEQLTATV